MTSKLTQRLHIAGSLWAESDGGFHSQRASNAETVSMPWCCHVDRWSWKTDFLLMLYSYFPRDTTNCNAIEPIYTDKESITKTTYIHSLYKPCLFIISWHTSSLLGPLWGVVILRKFYCTSYMAYFRFLLFFNMSITNKQNFSCRESNLWCISSLRRIFKPLLH